MKKGLRSVLFSVLVGALLLCAGCGKSGDIYTAGVYTASAEGYSGPVTVEVEFDGSSILSVHVPVSYTHLRAHETRSNLVCRLLLEKIFFNDTATTEIYTRKIVGSVRCV